MHLSGCYLKMTGPRAPIFATQRTTQDANNGTPNGAWARFTDSRYRTIRHVKTEV